MCKASFRQICAASFQTRPPRLAPIPRACWLELRARIVLGSLKPTIERSLKPLPQGLPVSGAPAFERQAACPDPRRLSSMIPHRQAELLTGNAVHDAFPHSLETEVASDHGTGWKVRAAEAASWRVRRNPS